MKMLKNKKILLAIGAFPAFFLVAFLGITFWIASFGFNNPYPCEYTQTEVDLPPIIKNTQLVLEKDMYLGTGKQPSECFWIMTLPHKELIDRESIDNLTIGKEYFEERGQKISPFPKGKTFEILRAISERKHGIRTVDSGSDGGVSLILKDAEGTEYTIHETSLGFDEREATIWYYRNGNRESALTWELMNDYYNKD